jgi:hypothetical protein
MDKATSAKVEYDSAKKRWEVHIEIGAEVIKRPMPPAAIDAGGDAGGDAIRHAAAAIAGDEGYQLDPAGIRIVQMQSPRVIP